MVRDGECGDVWNGEIWSGVTGYADGKVIVDDGEEGSGQREWNDELVAVEGEMEGQQGPKWKGEMEGQQGPKWKVALERWEEDGMEQKESEKRPLRDPTVEVQEAKESEQQV
eukprot:s5173_g5.t1